MLNRNFLVLSACILGMAMMSMTVLGGCGTPKNNDQKSDGNGTNEQDAKGQFELVKYGTMREAIGQQQHQGRVRFNELTKKPHFYGVAALEGLNGEAAIIDGELTVSKLGDSGELESIQSEAGQLQATMLVGGYVEEWHDINVEQDVAVDDFDSFLAKSAESLGVDVNTPFLFTIEGDFIDLHLHVINGACPVHARMQNQELPDERKPFELEQQQIKGSLIGIFARDAVGKLTHPASDTHRHLVFKDANDHRQVGHVEKGGIKAGAKLRIAK